MDFGESQVFKNFGQQALFNNILIWVSIINIFISMSFPFPLFAKIKDFSTLERQYHKNHSHFFSYKLKDPNNVETADSEESFQNQTSISKPQIKCQELSFERNFMLEHMDTYDFYVENYIDQIFEGQLSGIKTFTNETAFPKKRIFIDSPSQLMQYLRPFDGAISLKNAQIFMEDLVNQQKLKEFLQYVLSKSCDEVASELLLITLQVWEHYLKIQKEQMSYQMLVQHARNLVDQNWNQLKSNGLINYLNFEKTYCKPMLFSEQRIAEQKKFIEFFTVTLFLVICEYSKNPYHSLKVEAQLKRHIFFRNDSPKFQYDSFSESESSEEECMFIKSKKKRK